MSLNVGVPSVAAGTAVEVDEVDSSGNIVSKLTDLFDDGSDLHNDTAAGDGFFNNSIALSFAVPGDHFFVGRETDPVGNIQQTATVQISAIGAPSAADLQPVADANTAIGQQASNALTAGQSASQVLDGVQASLLAMPAQVIPSTIQRTPTAISWENSDGILSMIDTNLLKAELGVGSAPAATASVSQAFAAAPAVTVHADDTAAADAGLNAIVISPFDSFFSGTDEASFIDGALTSKGWNVIPKINSAGVATSVDDFKNLGQFGAVVITSYGQTLPGIGEVIETHEVATVGDMVSHVADLFNHRLVTVPSGTPNISFFAVTRRFIRTYSGRMQGSIVYVGHMGGLDDSDQGLTLADAFLFQGAKAFISYKTAAEGILSTDGTYPLDTSQEGRKAFNTLLGVTDPAKITVGDIPFLALSLSQTINAAGDLTATLPNLSRFLSDYDLYVDYSWQTSTSRDLDTNTEFLNSTAGFSGDNDNVYIHWGGDNTSGGGDEFATVNLNQAYLDGKASFGAFPAVIANAGWFAPSMGSGPATLTVALKNKSTGTLKDAVSQVIAPGSQDGLAATDVGDISITLAGDPTNPTVSFALTPG